MAKKRDQGAEDSLLYLYTCFTFAKPPHSCAMKTAFAKCPAWLWLVVSYVILGGAFYWSATQPPGRFAAIVFLGSLLACWIPAYAFANRHDIARNKAFWFSQIAGFIAGLLVACVLVPLVLIAQNSTMETDLRSHSWLRVLGGAIVWWIVFQMADTLIGRAFTIIESKVEESMSKGGRKS